MLDCMTPEEFDERLAADVLDPVDDSWRQTATLAATFANELRLVLYSFLGGNRQPEVKLPDEYIPTPAFLLPAERRRIRHLRRMSAAEDELAAAQCYS